MGKRTKKEMKLPPQLIGVHEDALRTAATAFKVQRFPTLVRASCLSQNQAMEIDFEIEAGQEMIDYVVGRSAPRKGKGRLVLEYEGKRFNCAVTTDGTPSPSWVEVRWALGNTKRGAEPCAGRGGKPAHQH